MCGQRGGGGCVSISKRGRLRRMTACSTGTSQPAETHSSRTQLSPKGCATGTVAASALHAMRRTCRHIGWTVTSHNQCDRGSNMYRDAFIVCTAGNRLVALNLYNRIRQGGPTCNCELACGFIPAAVMCKCRHSTLMCSSGGKAAVCSDRRARTVGGPKFSLYAEFWMLINMYAECSSLEDARSVFDKLPGRNVVVLAKMIAMIAQQGMGHETLALFWSTRQECFASRGCVTFFYMLQSCASAGVAALREGKQLYAEIDQQGLQKDGLLGVSFVNMRAKCGSLESARRLFEKLVERNTTGLK